MSVQFFNVRTGPFLARTIRVKSRTSIDATASRLSAMFARLQIEANINPIINGSEGLSCFDLFNNKINA